MKVFKGLTIALLAISLSGCNALFPKQPGPRLGHFADVAPAADTRVPDLTLYDLEGRVLSLHDLIGERPVVMRLGSHSCPVYRYRRFSMADLQQEYADRVRFVVVYTTEAHPVGSVSPYSDEEWLSPVNWITGVRVPQADDLEQRIAQARVSAQTLELPAEVYVDAMDNRFWDAFGRAPSPGFVLDRQGWVALRQVWVDPQAMRETLDRLLATGSSP